MQLNATYIQVSSAAQALIDQATGGKYMLNTKGAKTGWGSLTLCQMKTSSKDTIDPMSSQDKTRVYSLLMQAAIGRL